MNKKFLIVLFFLGACSTSQNKNTDYSNLTIEEKIDRPIKKIIKDQEASFDGNEQNSGIIDFVKEEGWLVTKRTAEKYNFLIEKYGKTITPPIEKNFGLTRKDENLYVLTQEAMVNFALMNQKYKLNKQ